MPPYAPSVLKRKYGGQYATSKKAKGSSSTTRSVVPFSRYAVAPRKVELKYDNGTVTTTVSTTGSVVQMLDVANGTGSSERIGKSIMLHDMTLNYNILPNAASSRLLWRCVIVYDRQTNGAAPSVTDVMHTTAVESMYNADNQTRFKVLYDQSGVIVTNATGIDIEYKTIYRNIKISLKGLRTEYSGTGSTSASIIKGGIYMILLGNTVTGYAITEANRIQFSDV